MRMMISHKFVLSIFLISLTTAGLSLLFKVDSRPLVLILSVSVLTALLSYPVIYLVFRPVIRLYRGIQMVQQGNLDYTVGSESKDEIGKFGRSIDIIIQNLKESSSSVNELSDEVAEQRQKGEDLQTSLNYFQRLFENANTAIYIYDMNGKIIEANRMAFEMPGYFREQLLKIPFQQLQTEEALNQSREAVKTGHDSLAIRFESVFGHKDGHTFPVEISSCVIDYSKGIMQSMVNDITNRKNTEEALRASEDRFRTFMETASDLMFMTDTEGKFIYVNHSMIRSLGYAEKYLRKTNIQDLIKEKSKKGIMELFDTWLSEDEQQYEIALLTKENIDFYGEIHAVGIYNSKREFQGIRGVVRDITERKKIEESMRLAQLGKMAADVAHAVKNQLTALICLAEMAVMKGASKNEMRDALKQINEQCWDINDVIRRLLTFSKPSRGDFVLTNIHATIDLVIKLVDKQYINEGIKIIKDFDLSLPTIRVDEKQMREVFLNLVQNAYEAIEGKGQIEITTKQQGEFVQIDFKDTGCGVSEAVLKRIFDPFFTTKEDGTGLGVSACYGIIKAHEGNLKYSGVPGQGTTVSVLLPLESPVLI